MKTKKSIIYSTILFMAVSIFKTNVIHAQTITKTPLTQETAQAIAEGKIKLESGKLDSLLFGQSALLPNEDSDQDGLLNKQELYTYTKNGKTFYGYNAHPKLYDTDGDGYKDSDEVKKTAGTNPLKWDISPRDMALFMELVYRDDDYIRKVLNDKLATIDNHEGRLEYTLMHNELAPYWKVKDTYHHSNGFDAVLFENVSELPFIISNQVQVLGIRGTKGAGDLDDDTAIAFKTVPKQVDSLEATLRNYRDRNQAGQNYVNNLYITGHSLGGYLSEWGAITSKREGLNFFRQNYTFNAPKISGNIFMNWVNDRGRYGDELTDRGISIHYKTENDGLISMIGNFYGSKSIGNSAAGHGSRSYFEERMNNIHRTHQIPGFTVGRRRNIHQTGYKDPNLANLRIFDNAAPNISISEGQKIFLWKYEEGDTQPRYEIPITGDETPTTIETISMYGNRHQATASNVGELRFEINNSTSKLVITGKANINEGEYNRVLKIEDYPHTLFTNNIKFVVMSARPTREKIVRKLGQPINIDNEMLEFAVTTNTNNYRLLPNEMPRYRLVNPIQASYPVGTHRIPVEVTNASGFKKIIHLTLEITQDPSQTPESINQTYSEISGQQIEVTFRNQLENQTELVLMKQNAQNQKIALTKQNNMPYTATKYQNKYIFDIDKSILRHGEAYFIKVKEPNKSETIVPVTLDLQAPELPAIDNRHLILFRNTLYYDFITNEEIIIKQNDKISAITKKVQGQKYHYTVMTDPLLEQQGLQLLDLYGNMVIYQQQSETRGKVDIQRPIRNQKKLVLTASDNNIKGTITVLKTNMQPHIQKITLQKGQNVIAVDTLKKGDIVTVQMNGMPPIKFTVR